MGCSLVSGSLLLTLMDFLHLHKHLFLTFPPCPSSHFFYPYLHLFLHQEIKAVCLMFFLQHLSISSHCPLLLPTSIPRLPLPTLASSRTSSLILPQTQVSLLFQQLNFPLKSMQVFRMKITLHLSQFSLKFYLLP